MRRGGWPSFRLRTLLIVVAGIAMVLGLWVVPAERQKKFVENTPGIGSWKLRGDAGWRNWIPDRIRGLRGGHYFDQLSELMIEIDFGEADDRGSGYSKVANHRWRQLRRSFPRLEKLDICGLQLSVAQASDLSLLKDLNSLSLRDVRFDRPDLVQIPRLPRLVEIVVDDVQVDDRAFPHLAESQCLADAIFDRTFGGSGIYGDELCQSLGQIGSLKELDLVGIAVTDKGVQGLSESRSIVYLNLNAPVTNIGANHLAEIKTIETLSLHRCYVTDRGIAALTTLPKLYELDIPTVLASPSVGVVLARSASLQCIDVRNAWLDSASASALAQMPLLEKLIVRGECLTMDDLADLAQSKTLNELWFETPSPDDHYYTKLDGDEIRHLRRDADPAKRFRQMPFDFLASSENAQLRLLRDLAATSPDAGGSPACDRVIGIELDSISQQDFALLAKCRKLASLSLTNMQLGDSEWRLLSRLDRLKDLRLTDCVLSMDDLSPLAPLQNLDSISISGSTIDNESFDQLLRKFMPQWERLDPSRSNVTSAGIENVHQIPFLKNLDLQDTAVDSSALSSLAKCLSLNDLNVNGTSIPEKQIALLAKKIRSIQSDAKDYWTSSAFMIDGSLDPSKLDEWSNPWQRSVEFRGQAVDDSILDALPTNEYLSAVDFHDCSASDDGVRRFLKRHAGVIAVQLTGQQCQPSTIEKLATLQEYYRLTLESEWITPELLNAVSRWQTELDLTLMTQRIDTSDLAFAFGRWPLNQAKRLIIKEMDIKGTGKVAEITAALKGHPRLSDLEIEGTNFTDDDCDWLFRGQVTDSGYAGFTSPIIGDDLVEKLSGHLWLTDLELNASRCSDKAIRKLSQCKHLRHLTLTDASISPTTLGRLSEMPYLQSLTLIRTPVETVHLTHLSLESKIKHVRLTEVDCRSVDLTRLSIAPYLVSLELVDCPVGADVDGSPGVLLARPNGLPIRITRWDE